MSADCFANYARKSNEQERVANGTTESVERQLQFNKEYGAGKGWGDALAYFEKDPVSGRVYTKLHERERMLRDAEAGKFAVLVVAEQSRLGRNAAEVIATVMRLQEAGVRVFERCSGQEIGVEEPEQLVM